MNKYRNTNAANTTKTYNKHEIEDPTNNIYEAISIISKRSSQINSEIKINNSFQIITMPRLSDTMEEGTVSSWLVNIGDTVQEGDILAEIETDKATMEFESFHEGTLLDIGIKVGETAKVDSLLAVIGDPVIVNSELPESATATEVTVPVLLGVHDKYVLAIS